MKVVYPYKKNMSTELLWSVASLKNVEHDGIVIVGDKPEFDLGQDYKYIFHGSGEYSSSPHHDQAVKYLLACAEVDDDELLLMNDDFFILSPWQPENYNRGILADQVAARRVGSYRDALINTENFLLHSGLTTFSYELHTPMLVNRLELQTAIDEIMPHMHGKRAILTRSYYGNRWGLKTAPMDDVKNIPDYKGKQLLSTSESTFLGEIGSYIRETLV